MLTGELVDHDTVAYSIVSDDGYPVDATLLRQPKMVDPLTRLSGEDEVDASFAVHCVALKGEVKLAMLEPAFVKVTPVGALGEYVAPPSLKVLVKAPIVNAAIATPATIPKSAITTIARAGTFFVVIRLKSKRKVVIVGSSR